jgi:hypothetical protein
MAFTDYKITTQDVGQAVKEIKDAFDKKRELERQIVILIKEWELETGLAIDSIKYQRDITLPIKSPKYTDLTILISAEEQ